MNEGRLSSETLSIQEMCCVFDEPNFFKGCIDEEWK